MLQRVTASAIRQRLYVTNGRIKVHPETRAFKSELNAHLNAEAAAEARQERVEAYADYLMEEGQSCYPFTPSHVSEALGEMSTGQLAVLAACLAEVVAHKSSDAHRNHLALCSILQPINQYWHGIAMKDAEGYIE